MVKKDPGVKSVYVPNKCRIISKCKIGFSDEKCKGFFRDFRFFYQNPSNNLYVINSYMNFADSKGHFSRDFASYFNISIKQ